ncbi:MAG: choice-of-anchor E domain-containing protein [Sedimentisphaerales bacterium]|nr:choice-of-anchor E domain-containing protein [Sedimentisphaerales bacterium]
MRFIIISILLFALILCSLFTGSAQAALFSDSHSDSISLTATNWSDVVTVPKFDPALGVLQSIVFDMEAMVNGVAGFENRDDNSATITLELIAIVTLKNPGGGNLLVTIPTASVTETVAFYDDNLDFTGSSGRTYSDLTDSETETFTSFAPADLALFTGLGDINLDVSAKGASSASGSGNLVLFFSTLASADITVNYLYIPEASTIFILVLGGVIVFRRPKSYSY